MPRKYTSLLQVTVFTIFSISLSGCIAVWGAGHKVVKADAHGITIQFDKGVTNSLSMQVIAKKHCKQFDKVAEPVSSEMPGALFGILEDTYSCDARAPSKS